MFTDSMHVDSLSELSGGFTRLFVVFIACMVKAWLYEHADIIAILVTTSL